MFGPDSRFSDFMANFLTFCEKSGTVGWPTVPDLAPPIAVYPLRRRRTIVSLLPRGRSCHGPCRTSSLRHPSSLHGTSFYCIHSLHRCNHLCWLMWTLCCLPSPLALPLEEDNTPLTRNGLASTVSSSPSLLGPPPSLMLHQQDLVPFCIASSSLLMQHINTGFCHGVSMMCPSVT